MNKSKFQLEEEKKQSILNCINSITGDLTESVISAPGVDLIGSMRMLKPTTDSSDNSNFAKQKVKSLIDPKLSLSTDNKQKYPFVTRPPFMLQTQINSNLNNSQPSFASKASNNPYMSANPEEDKDFVGPPSSLKDPEQDKDFVGPPSSLMNTSSTRPESPENTAAEIVNGNNQVGSPNISGTKPAEWRGRNGMTVDELNADTNRIKSDMQNRTGAWEEPKRMSASDMVGGAAAAAAEVRNKLNKITPDTIDRDNSRLAADRQAGVPNAGRYQGTPGVGSVEQANRGKVGLDVGMNPDNSPEAAKKRSEDGMKTLLSTGGWSQDPDGKMIGPEQTAARKMGKEQEYLEGVKERAVIRNSPEKVKERAEKATARDEKFHSDALKKLQDRTALTKAQKDLEDARKDLSTARGESTSVRRNVTEQAENTGAGGGSGDISGDASGITMGKEEENQWQASVNNLKQMPNIQDSMIAATNTASKFIGKSALWALANPVGKLAIGAVATPPENYFNTGMGSLGQLGFDNKNVAAHTRHYQNLFTKLGIPRDATADAASMATRVLFDLRSLPNPKKVNFGSKETEKDTESEEETDNSVPISSNKPAPKQLTSKP
jgi:hypothetical protein